jgi:ketosteroid isomerase-like protein
MNRMILLPLGLCMVAALALAQGRDNAAELKSMVETEREFSRTSVEKGIRDAFLTFIADDGTLFRPRPVAGKKWLAESPQRPGLLTWRPIFADIARSADLGYTTGPWEFREKGPDDKEVAHGNFMTVWKKQADGRWRFVIDFGISNPPPSTSSETLETPAASTAASAPARKGVDVSAERAALLTLDGEFSKSSAAKGALKAYLLYASDDIRLLRNRAQPMVGKQALGAALGERAGTLTWQPLFADVSGAGDLGYTYGSAEFKDTASGKTEYRQYVRIWKRPSGGEWRVVLDVTNPAPPPASKTDH